MDRCVPDAGVFAWFWTWLLHVLWLFQLFYCAHLPNLFQFVDLFNLCYRCLCVHFCHRRCCFCDFRAVFCSGSGLYGPLFIVHSRAWCKYAQQLLLFLLTFIKKIIISFPLDRRTFIFKPPPSFSNYHGRYGCTRDDLRCGGSQYRYQGGSLIVIFISFISFLSLAAVFPRYAFCHYFLFSKWLALSARYPPAIPPAHAAPCSHPRSPTHCSLSRQPSASTHTSTKRWASGRPTS